MSDSQLIELFKKVDSNTLWGMAIQVAINKGSDIGQLVLDLQSQHRDNPAIMRSMLGEQLTNYITEPLSKPQIYAKAQAITIKRSKRGRKASHGIPENS